MEVGVGIREARQFETKGKLSNLSIIHHGMRIIFPVIVLGMLLVGCTQTAQLPSASANLAALYNPSAYSMNADLKVYHITDEMSTLYIRLFPNELLFNQANNENEYRAMVRLQHALFELDDKGAAVAKIDSGVSQIKLGEKEQQRSAFLTSLLLPVPMGKKYILRMDMMDMQRGTSGLSYILIDKSNRLSAQNFSVVSASSGVPKFMDFQRSGEVFSLRHRDRDHDSIYLDFFKYEYELPRPPVRLKDISYFLPEKDTTIALPYSDSMIYTLPGTGMYHFRFDTLSEAGLTLYNFGRSYPQIRSEADMIKSLFYIAYPVEYKDLVNSGGNKMALDEFWLRRVSNMDRARELIRIYYNRVLYSNIFFTAGQEGWKTDRGMVYILFGPPDRMRDDGARQVWYYISSRRSQIIEFRFRREANHYTEKAFILEKDNYTVRYLDDAIRSWNKGRVYSIKN